ncbi:MAG: ribose 5-phosphate isomerase A [Sulfolobales archaeon]
MSHDLSEEILSARKEAVKKMIHLLTSFDVNYIGVGSGSTIKLFIEYLPKEILIKKCFISSSFDTSINLRSRGARCVETDLPPEKIDLYIDSADEIDKDGNLLKGGGGALFREKIIAYSSEKRFILADYSKLVNFLGSKGKIPIELHPYSLNYVSRRIRDLGMILELRVSSGKVGPVISDNGNIIADIIINEPIKDPLKMDREIKSIEGVLATGLFPYMDYVIIVGEKYGEARVYKGEDLLKRFLANH